MRGSPGSYWPQQAWRDAAACFIVLAVVVGLSARHGVSGPQAGIELGAPANPVDDPGTARPEWSFRGLYQLHEMLSGWPEMVSIFVIPGLTVLLFFAMPLIGRNLAGRALNVALALLVFGGMGVLAWLSYAADAKNAKYQAALEEGRQQAQRVKELADSPEKIPVSGALTLAAHGRQDPRPRLFNQHCASCHDYSGEAIVGITHPEKPTAADLYGFAGREWLTDVPDRSKGGISSPKFFGNTKFKQKKMYGFIKETFADFEANEKQQIIEALSHEAALKSQRDADAREAKNIAAGRRSSRRIAPNATPSIARPKARAQGPRPDGIRQPRVADRHRQPIRPTSDSTARRTTACRPSRNRRPMRRRTSSAGKNWNYWPIGCEESGTSRRSLKIYGIVTV